MQYLDVTAQESDGDGTLTLRWAIWSAKLWCLDLLQIPVMIRLRSGKVVGLLFLASVGLLQPSNEFQRPARGAGQSVSWTASVPITADPAVIIGTIASTMMTAGCILTDIVRDCTPELWPTCARRTWQCTQARCASQ